MAILNIIDRRKRPYRFAKINAVLEPTRHDNSVKDCDRAPRNPTMDKNWIGYDEREHITVAEALRWAQNHKDLLTLYLYDRDGGIYARKAVRVNLKQRSYETTNRDYRS